LALKRGGKKENGQNNELLVLKEEKGYLRRWSGNSNSLEISKGT